MQSKLAKELKAKREMCEAQQLVAQKQRLEFDHIRKQLEVSDSYVDEIAVPDFHPARYAVQIGQRVEDRAGNARSSGAGYSKAKAGG